MQTSAVPSFLALLKQQSNLLNRNCQQFQTEIQSLINELNVDKSFIERLNKLCNEYATSLNKILIGYLLTFESTASSKPKLPKPILQPPPKPKPPSRSHSPISLINHPVVYKCDKCNISYSAKSSLRRHNKKKHLNSDDSNIDTSSSSSSDSENTSVEHQATTHNRNNNTHNTDETFESLKCDMCCKVYGTLSSLNTHKLTHLERPFQCKDCFSNFKLDKYLVQHIINVHDKDPYKCSQCDQTFRRKTDMKIHIKDDHNSDNDSESSNNDMDIECDNINEIEEDITVEQLLMFD